jgi:hypothetical protein
VSTLLRRLPLSRLLLLCAVVVAVGIGATALALAVDSGPVPAPKPLDEAVHDALSASPVEGVSARIQLTNHLIEGASLASNGGGESSQLASSPLITGASGRLWVGSDGHARLELQSEKGDTQLLWDGKTAELYDASTNTLYRYTPQHSSQGSDTGSSGSSDSSSTSDRRPPSVAQIDEGIEHLEKHAQVSGATPTDVGGQPAYTVRLSPREDGGLIGGVELSWDAVHGLPLRAAVYSRQSSSPVLELAATEISYGPVDAGTLDFTTPQDAQVKEVKLPTKSSDEGSTDSNDTAVHPHATLHGNGLGAIALVESPLKEGEKSSSQAEGLRKVDINGTSASELPTALGTLLSFERAGVRYLLAGSVTPSAIEAFARSL